MKVEMGAITGYGERFGQRVMLTRAQLAAQLRRRAHEYDALLDTTGRLTHLWIADNGARGHFEAATQQQTLDHEAMHELALAKSAWIEAKGTADEAARLADYNAARVLARTTGAFQRAQEGRR